MVGKWNTVKIANKVGQCRKW